MPPVESCGLEDVFRRAGVEDVFMLLPPRKGSFDGIRGDAEEAEEPCSPADGGRTWQGIVDGWGHSSPTMEKMYKKLHLGGGRGLLVLNEEAEGLGGRLGDWIHLANKRARCWTWRRNRSPRSGSQN